jgi:mRNA-degrading endonuclease RelE of RelBE toxin-antitoxin system
MNYDIKPTPTFLKGAKKLSRKYPSLKSDLSLLKETLLTNPKTGVDLGGGTYKVRMAL